MSNRDLYKDEFGVYREVEEETEETIDGMEDDEQDHYEDEDNEDEYLDSDEYDDDADSDDEDAAYLKERRSDYDVDED